MSKKNQHNYPKLESRILNIVLPDTDIEPLNGDFFEIYFQYREKHGFLRAKLWLWKQIFKSVPLFIINSIKWSFIMFGNYLKTTLRNIRKHKGYSFINVSGLAVGMTSFILILLWVQDELSYDKFHEKAENIYRVNGSTHKVMPSALSAAMISEIPEIENAVRMRHISGKLVVYKDKTSFIRDYFLADKSFFEIFTFPLVKGNKKTALSDKYSIVITEETAEKYFGEENPLGKIMIIDNRFSFTVSGVLKNIPETSQLKFDFLIRLDFLEDYWGSDMNSWESSDYMTYVLLKNGVSAEDVTVKINNLMDKRAPEKKRRAYLQALTDIHLKSPYSHEFGGKGNMTFAYILSIVAVFILLTACINFMNLSTAKGTKRAKEIGVRKVIGAQKNNIIVQCFFETICLAVISLILSVMLVLFLLPIFNSVTGKQFTFVSLFNTKILSGLLFTAIFTGIVSGSYPAFIISSIKPVKALTGSIFAFSSRRSNFRNILVVLQFLFSVILIACTIVLYKQMTYINNLELGYDKENIICFNMTIGQWRKISAANNELANNQNITDFTYATTVPGYRASTTEIDWPQKSPEKKVITEVIFADYDFIPTFNIEIIEGRDYSREFGTDRTDAVIVNESLVKEMDTSAMSALGKQISIYGRTLSIIGVVKDFHSRSLHYKVEPLVISLNPGYNNLCLRVKRGKIQDTINFMSSLWEKFTPNYPFNFRFFDEWLDDLYISEKIIKKILYCFTFLAIFISCLGLFGLVSYAAEQRQREIGIRKVFGASVLKIIKHLTKEYVLLVIIANVIALPVSYLFMNKWLQNFAYHTDFSIWIFILSFILSLGIALTTVSYRFLKAALVNPVESIRNE